MPDYKNYRRSVYVLSLTIFLASLSWNQIIPFMSDFLDQMGVAKGQLLNWTAVVFAAQTFASVLAMPFWGKLGDQYGRKPMIIRAGICLAGIYFGMSLCRTPLQLVTLRFLNGILTGFIPGAYALIATNTPEDQAAKAIATAQTASAAGLILGPAIGGYLASWIGYRHSMHVSGICVIFCLLLVWLFVEEPNKVKPGEKTNLLQDFLISIRCPVQLSLICLVALEWTFGAAINPYLVYHLEHLGSSVPKWLSSSIFPLPALAFVLVARSWTTLGERWGFERIAFFGLIGSALGTTILYFAWNVYVFAIIYFMVGLWLAAILPSIGAITCAKVDESFRGRAYGIQQSAGILGALMAPVAAAQVGTHFGIRSIFILEGAILFFGSIVFLRLVKRWQKKKIDANPAC